MRRAGIRISEFGTVYGNFVFSPSPSPTGRKVISLSLPDFPSLQPCFLLEVFGKCSGRLRKLPKPSRRNPEETPNTIRLQSAPENLSGTPISSSKIHKRKDSRIRYRTRKSGFRPVNSTAGYLLLFFSRTGNSGPNNFASVFTF